MRTKHELLLEICLYRNNFFIRPNVFETTNLGILKTGTNEDELTSIKLTGKYNIGDYILITPQIGLAEIVEYREEENLYLIHGVEPVSEGVMLTIRPSFIPRNVVKLSERILAWLEKNDHSKQRALQSESIVGVYSWQSRMNENGSSITWEDEFKKDLSKIPKNMMTAVNFWIEE